MPSDTELLAARLARMKTLVARLEDICSENEEQRDACARLNAEIEAARAALKPAQ